MAFKRTLTAEQINAQRGFFQFKLAANILTTRIDEHAAAAIRQALKESTVLRDSTAGIGEPMITIGQRTHLNGIDVDEPATVTVIVPSFPHKDDIAYSAHAGRIIAKQLRDYGMKLA